jgi:hypothetical protein
VRLDQEIRKPKVALTMMRWLAVSFEIMINFGSVAAVITYYLHRNPDGKAAFITRIGHPEMSGQLLVTEETRGSAQFLGDPTMALSPLCLFKNRARHLAKLLQEIFGPTVGEAKVFSNARVLELLARQEGYTCYAAVKATQQPQQRHSENGSKSVKYFIGFFAMFERSPNELVEELKYSLNLLLSQNDWWRRQPVYALLVTWPDGYEFCVHFHEPGDTLKSIWLETKRFRADTTFFLSCLQVGPAPQEWLSGTLTEYIDSFAQDWFDKLSRHMKKQLFDVLKPFDEIVRNIKEALYIGPTHDADRTFPPPPGSLQTDFWGVPTLVEAVRPHNDIMVLKCIGHYVLCLLPASRIADSGPDSSYSLPFFMLDAVNTELGFGDRKTFSSGVWYRLNPGQGGLAGIVLGLPQETLKDGMLALDIPPSLKDKHGDKVDYDVYDRIDGLVWLGPMKQPDLNAEQS